MGAASGSVFAAGYNGTATINGVEVPIMGWSLRRTATVVDFKNSRTGVFPARDTTFQDISADLTLDRDFGSGNNPNSLFQQGQTITNVILYEKQTAHQALNGPTHIISSMVVPAAPVSLNVNGKIVYSMTALITGTYTPPTT